MTRLPYLVTRSPPFFVLWFAFSTQLIPGSGRAVKNGEGLGTPIMWMMSGGCEVNVGGAVPILQTHVQWNHRVSFLTSTVDLMNAWGPGYRWSDQWWSLVRYLNMGPSPYVHLASTRRQSRDRCSQAFPLRATILFCCCLKRKYWLAGPEPGKYKYLW